ncbi:uncharacterized protein TM35_000016140 [Trypanosoma theileri]|uniref:VPS9 domain-containing protein n=1 Tax=Trypanosoma theileri TaxID=67003 RepID=A0A1X0P9X5_9TRYP|nr:uncharacterized protein TM35_000016140 [Trypanosoma theileri]ORC93737.1 hypothetical protein TM35_000016140 [Trypanosoma theileri]
MPNDSKRNHTVEHRSTKGNKNNHLSVNDMQYAVVKKHHRHKWLRQERLLEITSTHIYNCKPSQGNNTVPKITKQFPLTSITTIGLKGKKAFCIHVRDDHVYYYYTPKAIEIAFKIQRYVAAANAVDILIGNGDRDDDDNNDNDGKRKSILMEQLVSGAIPLPGAHLSNTSGASTHRGYRSIKLRCEINRTLRNGKIQSAEELNKLALTWKAKSEYDEMNLPQLRRSIDNIRDECAINIMEESYLSQRGITYSEVVMCVEDIIQKVIITPNFDKIMFFLRRDEDLVNREELFNRNRELLRGKSAKIFNVRKDLRSINYKLVLRHFELLMTLRNPNDFLDQLVNIAACIYLTLHVASKFGYYSNVNEGLSASCRNGETCNATVGSYTSPLLLRSPMNGPSKAKSIVLSLSSESNEIQDSLEKDNTHNIPQFQSNSCKSIVLSVDEMKRTFSDLSFSLPTVENGRRQDDAKISMFSLDSSSENSEEKLPSSQLRSSSSLFNLLEKDGLSADDMIPLYIHLLCESDVSDLCFIVNFIELLGDSDDTSERAYYYTTLRAAIAVLCEWKPEDMVSTNTATKESNMSRLKFVRK